MKNSKNKNSITILLLIALFFSGTSCLFSQDMIQTTNYYDYTSGVLYSNDVGEAIVSDPVTVTYYTAGEISLNDATQGIHIRRFNQDGVELNSRIYNDTNYREYVKKIICTGNHLYVICNAVRISSGISTLLVIKFNSSLGGNYTYSYFNGLNYHDPVDAYATSSSVIYIACYKRTGTSDQLAVLKINSSLILNNSFTMFHDSINDAIRENPKQIICNPVNNCVYIAGGSYRPSDGQTATIAIKLSNNLAPVWVMKSKFKTGKNIYNSVARAGSGVFFAGSRNNSGKNQWTIRKLNDANGATEITKSLNFTSQDQGGILKITFADLSKIIVVGYVENTNLKRYDLKIGNYDGIISGTPTIYGTSLTPGSVISDALTTYNGKTYVTGQKYIGGIKDSRNMFFYAFDFAGNLFFRDSIINQNAGGNKIAWNLSASSFVAVTGFKNSSSIPAQPTDFKIATRFYTNSIPRLANGTSPDDIKIYPNPCNDVITIENTEAIHSYALYDMMGKTLAEKKLSDEIFEEKINIASFPQGIYLLKINNTATRKIIKN